MSRSTIEEFLQGGWSAAALTAKKWVEDMRNKRRRMRDRPSTEVLDGLAEIIERAEGP